MTPSLRPIVLGPIFVRRGWGAATEAGLDPGELESGISDPAVKAALREATDAAWEAGVRGAPTVFVDGAPFFGDDRLEEAAALLGRP